MSSTALSYYYAGGTTVSAIPSPSAFTLAAPNLYDGAVGDTTTYNAVNQTGSGGGSYYFYAMIDLGPSPPPVTKWTAQAYGNSNGGMEIFYAASASAGWTAATGSGVNVPGPYTETFSPITARYWCVSYTGGGSYPYLLGMTDLRLYDSAGNVILPPGMGSASPPQNLTMAIIY